MRERLQEFLDHMEMVTSKELSDNEREAVFNDFMKQIQFFQNERLIHLIVTVTFAIIAIFTTLANYVLQSICVFVFLLAIYILLLFYIRHYFFLERGVQKLYLYYDKLVKTLIIVMMWRKMQFSLKIAYYFQIK